MRIIMQMELPFATSMLHSPLQQKAKQMKFFNQIIAMLSVACIAGKKEQKGIGNYSPNLSLALSLKRDEAVLMPSSCNRTTSKHGSRMQALLPLRNERGKQVMSISWRVNPLIEYMEMCRSIGNRGNFSQS